MPSTARSRSASASTMTPFLPPSSRLRRFRRRAAMPAMRVPVSPLPVKLMTETSGTLDDRQPDLFARTADHVHGARREARLVHQLHEQDDAVRGIGRGLDDHRVAGHQGRHHLPAGDGHREVPGRDDAGYADRLADAHGPLVGQLRGHRVAEHATPFAGHQEGDVDALLDVAPRLGQDLAHLPRHGTGEALLVVGHQGAEAVEDLATLGGGHRPPGRKGGLGGPDGHRRVARIGGGEGADEVARVGRVTALERATRVARAPLPADEVAEAGRRDRRYGAGGALEDVAHGRHSRRVRPGWAGHGQLAGVLIRVRAQRCSTGLPGLQQPARPVMAVDASPGRRATRWPSRRHASSE